MVTELRELMRETVANPPADIGDLDIVVRRGRRSVRRRQVGVTCAVVMTIAAVITGSMALTGFIGGDDPAPAKDRSSVPTPAGPVLRLDDAEPAVAGVDYEVVAAYTNDDLDADNGQYLDGTTDDGLVLFRDGPRAEQLWPRYALMDASTGEKDWLPKLDIGQETAIPLILGEDQLVLLGQKGYDAESDTSELVAYTFDRRTRQWHTMTWPDLPGAEGPWGVTVGPDGRLYVRAPATRGQPPKGGWPKQPDGDAEDADAEGDTFHLWSASLTDPGDVRDENLTVGAIAFTDTSMVWSDGTNGDAGMMHVRDLATGEESSFDPHLGERCNLLGFGASGDRIVMSQYCGTYEGGTRDDRVQVFTTSGELIVTIQDPGIIGVVPGAGGSSLVEVWSYDRKTEGTYVYDLDTDRFLRVSESLGRQQSGESATGAGELKWVTAVNAHKGTTQIIAEWLAPTSRR